MIVNEIDNIKELIDNILLGKQYELVKDQDLVTAITTYRSLIGVNDEDASVSEIIIDRFGRELLINPKTKVLENIIKFNPGIRDRIKSEITELNSLSDSQLYRKIKTNFHYNNKAFCKSILNCLNIHSDYFLPDKDIKDLTDDPLQEPQYKLHDFQKNIKDRSVFYLLNPKQTNRHILHLPTGAGKTKTAMEIMSDYIRSKSVLGGFNYKSTIIWITHSTELCEQSFDSFQATWLLRGDCIVNTVKFYDTFKLIGQYKEGETTIIFMGFAKIVAALRRDDDQKDLLAHIRDKTDLVIIDEAHRAMAPEWNKAIEYFADNSSTQMMGLTATPGLGDNTIDNEFLASYFNWEKVSLMDEKQVPIENPINHLRELEYLAELDYTERFTNYELQISPDEMERIKLDDTRLKNVLIDVSINPQRNKILIKDIITEYQEGKKILVFACSVLHCTIIQSLLNYHQIKSGVITAKNKSSRNQVIDDFKNGDLNILINFGVLTTGFDAPQINTAIIARPTFSIVLYSQMVGRALRGPKNGGNKKNRLITLRDNLLHGDMEALFRNFDTVWN